MAKDKVEMVKHSRRKEYEGGVFVTKVKNYRCVSSRLR